MSPLRICFVTHAALPHLGGVEVVVHNLARALRARGHLVEHIAPRQPPNDDAVLADGVSDDEPVARTVSASHLIERLTGLQYPVVGREFARAVSAAASRADVVHAHTYLFMTSALALAIAARAARGTGRPVRVLTDHGSKRVHTSLAMRGLESLAIESVGQLALRSAQAVVPVSTRVARDIEGVRAGKVGPVIPNGVDTDLFRPSAAGERNRIRDGLGWDERPRLLFVGRATPAKGVDLAVAVAARLGADAELVLVGPGRRQDLPPNVSTLGPLPQEELARLYRAADCLLVTSPNEGFPLVVQEAIASGLPAAIPDDPGYGGYLADAPTGIALVPRTSEGILAGLRGLDLGRGVGDSDRAALADFARARFSWARSAGSYERLYRRLLDGHATRGRTR